MAEEIVFKEMEVTEDYKRVIWEWIGEGNSGEYNPDDPEDTPLLRFSCYEFGPVDPGNDASPEEWYQLDDASYCTMMPVNSPRESLRRGAKIILEAINTNSSFKKELERLSWFCLEDFEEKTS